MVEKEDRSVVWSGVLGQPIELINGKPVSIQEKVLENTSLTAAVLRSRGFDSIVQMYLAKDNSRIIPVDILRELVLVDSLETDALTKTKLAIYRVWAIDGHYSRVKEYFPETSIGLEQIQTTMSGRSRPARAKPLEEYVNEVMMDEGELGRNYNIIHYRANLINKLLPRTAGLSYIRKYELLAKIINEVTKNKPEIKISRESIEQIMNIFEREIVGLENRIRSETRLEKAKSQRKKEIKEKEMEGRLQEDPHLSIIEALKKKGLSSDEIQKETGLTKRQIDYRLSALYFTGRLKPRKSNSRRSNKYKEFALKVESVKNESINEPLTNQEIAEILGLTKSQVVYASRILMLLNRVQSVDHSKLEIRVKGIRQKAREALFNSKIKINFVERPVVFAEISRNTGISPAILSEEYTAMRGLEGSPVSQGDFWKAKRDEFYLELDRHSFARPDIKPSIQIIAKRLNINPKLASEWVRKRK